MFHKYPVQIIDASRFWAREISMGDASDEAKQFQQLTARLNNYGETAKMKAHIDNPVLGEVSKILNRLCCCENHVSTKQEEPKCKQNCVTC